MKILHKNNLAHLDIKPENVVYNAQNQIFFLIDFEHMYTCKPNTYYICNDEKIGTDFFLPPEIHHGYYHQNSDLWNLGLLVFILGFRCNPFMDNINDNYYLLNFNTIAAEYFESIGYFRISKKLLILLNSDPEKRG